MDYIRKGVLVYGNGQLSVSVVICLLNAGHPVTFITENIDEAIISIDIHILNASKFGRKQIKKHLLKIVKLVDQKTDFDIAIAVTDENLLIKKSVIEKLEKILNRNSIIAINTECIRVSELQNGSHYPDRIIGLNWVEPAHTSFFLEIITNIGTNNKLSKDLYDTAKNNWQKDPYLVSGDVGIRARLFSVMVREAFYLVENGYASIEDIDRACRNDAGYYLPFAGNFRYMDLMGTYAYGLVMKDLNKELSKESKMPDFFKKMVDKGELGMENGKGFYEYKQGDPEHWRDIFSKFNYQIRDLIAKYPFEYRKYLKEETQTESIDE